MAEGVIVAIVLIELLMAVQLSVVVLIVVGHRREAERTQRFVDERLTRIERRLTPAAELAEHQRHYLELERQKLEVFQVYGLDEGT
ncbi:MAG: hypothetical protein AAGA65_30660 [Actinomycetota bacterium]